jgi:hypothetical protein
VRRDVGNGCPQGWTFGTAWPIIPIVLRAQAAARRTVNLYK